MQSTKFELEGTATIGKASLLSFSAMQFSVMILYLALKMHEILKVGKYFQLLDLFNFIWWRNTKDVWSESFFL